jgi:hypothetical protein
MAVRYPIISGDWSNALIWNGGTLPTSVDDVYSNGFTVTIDQDVTVLSIRNTAQSPAVAGGGYILLDTYTLNAALFAGAVNLLTYSGSTSANINGNLSIGSANYVVNFNSASGTLNIVGNLQNNGNSGRGLFVNNTGTVNIVGDVFSSASFTHRQIFVFANATINITGNIYTVASAIFSGEIIIDINSTCTLNIVGNVSYLSNNATSGSAIRINTANCVINITGNVSGGAQQNQNVINSSQIHYLKIVGSIFLVNNPFGAAIESNNSAAINIFTGPFVCSSTGIMPIRVTRMHYFRTINSYFEFRDETTNGALPPSTPATATRLVSPDTAVDAPIPANVRDGISYALGTFTGTLKVPPVNAVSAGVPTDNTVGTAVLKAEDVWNYATANLTDPNSIGARLKNVSTVDTTGEQLEALL